MTMMDNEERRERDGDVDTGADSGLVVVERYSHEGYLIKVVVLAVAGRSLDMVEPNPIHGLIKNITI